MGDQQEESPAGRGTVRTWWHTMPSPIRLRRITTFGALLAIGLALVVVGGIKVAGAGSIAGAEPIDLIATAVGVVLVLATPPMVLRFMTVDLADVEATLDDDWSRSQTLRSVLGLDDHRTDRDPDATDEG